MQVSHEGQTLSLGERKIIINIFIYFKTENPSLKRNALVGMTVKATGTSATSVKRIVHDEDRNKSPGKSRPKERKHSTDLFDLGMIRHMMHFMPEEKAQH